MASRGQGRDVRICRAWFRTSAAVVGLGSLTRTTVPHGERSGQEGLPVKPPIHDVHVTIKLRNNQLMARREAMGLTQIEVAEGAGIPIATLSGLESLRISPVRTLRDYKCRCPGCTANYAVSFSHSFCRRHAAASEGDKSRWLAAYTTVELEAWTTAADKLAAFFECDPVDLFPSALRAIDKPTVVSTMDVPHLLAVAGMASGEPSALSMPDAVEADQVRDALAAAAGDLTPRQQRIVLARFVDDKTQAEIGEEEGLCGARIAQLERKALAALRKNKRLRDATGET